MEEGPHASRGSELAPMVDLESGKVDELKTSSLVAASRLRNHL